MGEVNLERLLDLQEAIEADPVYAPLRNTGARYVPGVGADWPKAFVVGEAPGAMENLQGRPFCGASGAVLHQLLDLAGMWVYPESNPMRLPNTWLTNSIKYRPPGNRTPNVRETLAATAYLREEFLAVGSPRLIVCVGRAAAHAMGQLGPYPHNGDLWRLPNSKTYICYQYHPAYGLRNGPKTREMIERQYVAMGAMIEELREELEWDR